MIKVRGKVLEPSEFLLYPRYLSKSILDSIPISERYQLIDIQCKFIIEDLDTYLPILIRSYSLEYVLEVMNLSQLHMITIHNLAFSKSPGRKDEINLFNHIKMSQLFCNEYTWDFVLTQIEIDDNDDEVVDDSDDEKDLVNNDKFSGIGTKSFLLSKNGLMAIKLESIELQTMAFKMAQYHLQSKPVKVSFKEEVFTLLSALNNY